LGGFRALPKGWTVQWKHFFPLDGATPQLSRRLDTRLAEPLRKLPPAIDDARRSLGLLNMMRGRSLQLPSGQAVAAAMGTAVPDKKLGLVGETPLWFYLLREHEILGQGRRLGPTGGRIVAEVLVGLLKGDPSSFLRQEPAWHPELPAASKGPSPWPTSSGSPMWGRRSPVRRALVRRALAPLLLLLLGVVGAGPAGAATQVTLSPSSGPPGSTFTVTGTGFDAADVELHWDTRDGELLTTATGPDFSVSATVPDGAPANSHPVVAVVRDGSRTSTSTAAFQVTGPAD